MMNATAPDRRKFKGLAVASRIARKVAPFGRQSACRYETQGVAEAATFTFAQSRLTPVSNKNGAATKIEE